MRRLPVTAPYVYKTKSCDKPKDVEKYMKFGSLGFETTLSVHRVLSLYLHHSSHIFFSSEFYLTFPFSLLSVVFQNHKSEAFRDDPVSAGVF